MQMPQSTTSSVRIFSESEHPILDVFGPTVQFLTTPEEAGEELCVMKGVVPPLAFAPLHSHEGVECFFVLSQRLEVLVETDGEFNWMICRVGDFIQIPSNAKHAFRNLSAEPAVTLINTTAELGHFFEDIGRPVSPGRSAAPPTPDELEHFLEVAMRYGYWLATPEQNAAVWVASL